MNKIKQKKILYIENNLLKKIIILCILKNINKKNNFLMPYADNFVFATTTIEISISFAENPKQY